MHLKLAIRCLFYNTHKTFLSIKIIFYSQLEHCSSMLQVLELWSWFLLRSIHQMISFDQVCRRAANQCMVKYSLKDCSIITSCILGYNQATKNVELIRAEKWERFRKIILFFSFSMRFAKSGGINLREPERDGSSFVSGRDGARLVGAALAIVFVFDCLPHC